jgi:uncharacterized protein (TIGR02598 family)
MRANCLSSVVVRQRGFSLVEIALALAILAMALVALLGLLPSGMGNFRNTMDTTITSQIAQRILEEAEQTEFNELVDRSHLPEDSAGKSYCPERFSFRGPRVEAPGWRYFDEQGNEIVPKGSAASLSVREKRLLVYQVNTRIRPRAELPTINESGGQVAQITVQIIRNPNLTDLALEEDSESPEYNLVKAGTRLPVFTYSGLIGRNSGR